MGKKNNKAKRKLRRILGTKKLSPWDLNPKNPNVKVKTRIYYGLNNTTWTEIPMSLLNPIESKMDIAQDEKTFRVPLFKKLDTFILWTGAGTVRYFDADNLPDLIKSRLGLIMNSPYAAELNAKEMANTDFEQSNMQNEVYLSKFGKDYEDIGWQYNKYYYCLVLTETELASLQGS